MVTILIVLAVLMIGAIPVWPHSRKWGYLPSGGLGMILWIVFLLLMAGRIQG